MQICPKNTNLERECPGGFDFATTVYLTFPNIPFDECMQW